jgi:ComF family protein
MASLEHVSRRLRPFRPLPPAVKVVARRLLDAILPPQCLSCRDLVAEPGQLCAQCWSDVRFIDAPYCAVCGRPFEFDTGPDALCGDCAAHLPAYTRARAVMIYDEASRDLILGFKRGDRLEGAPAFGQWMARSGRSLLDGADLILPVPLHRRRLFSRRFNQAAVLAHAIGKSAGIPVLADGLVRKKPTPSQAGLSRSGRYRNVRGAFAVRPRYKEALRGLHVILVDDVMTTGATVESCTKTLLRGGAASVSVITLARVIQHL